MQLAQNSTNLYKQAQFEPFEDKVGIQTVHFNERNQIESSETKPIEVYLGAFSETCEEFLKSRRFISNIKILD
tara:strand:+ start:625 stop:843 length:219 start_codon:yes stop_codon:yes gene_type:complete